MIRAIQTIDSALKRLYRLENGLPAELFLVAKTPLASVPGASVGSAYGSGALLVVDQPTGTDQGIEVGIYFDRAVRDTLSSFEKWPRAEWSSAQVQAFSVAVEELSHFNYLVERASRDRAVTQFELELQGEVDRFVMGFFAERHQRKAPSFEETFSRFFENFHWDEKLAPDKRARYEDAHRLAKSLIGRLRPAFRSPRQWPVLVEELRRFHSASMPEKIRTSQR